MVHTALGSPLIEKAASGAQTVSQEPPAFCLTGSWSGDVFLKTFCTWRLGKGVWQASGFSLLSDFFL